jgi:hypothetical protein
MQWWAWMLIGWVVVAVGVALLLGRVIREADRRAIHAPGAAAGPVRLRVPARAVRRRRLPVPPMAVPLVGIGVTLEAVGFVVRAAGQESGSARLLAMDLPLSLPRMYITALLAAAALTALLGAARSHGRRTWWVAVGLVAAVVAEVKGGGTVHVRALEALGVGGRPVLAAMGSAVVLGAVLGTLAWLSRGERRDRRRLLIAFSLYGLAAVGLSAVSSLVGQSVGASVWSAAATFVEESGEVVGAVAVLIAVLAGVAPRLVLPAEWVLRRAVDAETLDAPGTVPARTTGTDRLRY